MVEAFPDELREFANGVEDQDLPSEESRARRDHMLQDTWESLTHTERTYYESWVTWKTFKRTLPPWRYFGTKGEIKHDHIKMIEQFEKMMNQRQELKRKAHAKREERRDQNNSRPVFPNRSNRTTSVL